MVEAHSGLRSSISYRKTGTSVVFSAVAVVSLVAQAVVIFALGNLAIFRIDPSEFVDSRRDQTLPCSSDTHSARCFSARLKRSDPLGRWQTGQA